MKSFASKPVHFTKICISLLLASIVLISMFTGTDICASQLKVCDPVNNKTYSISQSNRSVTIASDGKSESISFSEEIIDAVCFDSKFTILAKRPESQNVFHYTLMSYNAQNGDITTLATTIAVNNKAVSFCGDENGNFYLLDNKDNTAIHILSQTGNRVINTNTPVYQLLYMGNNEILVFTSKGTSCIANGIYTMLSTICPATPCSYLAKNKLADSNAVQYIYENSQLTKIVPTTEENDALPLPADSQHITEISQTHITITKGTTFAALYKELGIKKADLTVCKPDGKIVDSGTLGTGMTAKFSGYTLQIIVLGDLTGEGNINSRDLKVLMKHLNEESLLEGAYLKAADLYTDNTVNTKDLLALSKIY